MVRHIAQFVAFNNGKYYGMFSVRHYLIVLINSISFHFVQYAYA